MILLLLPPVFWNCRHGHHTQPCCFVSHVVLGVKSRTFCTLAKHGFSSCHIPSPCFYLVSAGRSTSPLPGWTRTSSCPPQSHGPRGFWRERWISTVCRVPIELPCPVLWGRLSTQTTGSGSLRCPGHHSGDVRQHSTGENPRRHPPQVIHKSALGGGMGEQFH